MPDPVYITGLGSVSPFGDSVAAFRDALLAGTTGIVVNPAFEKSGCRSTLAARVSGFEPAKWIPPMKLRRMDTTGPFALVAVRQAMEAAGYRMLADGDPRTGVILGTYSAGGQASNEYLEALFRGGPTGAPAVLFNSTVGNAAAGLVGLEHKLCGPNATVTQKEASGLGAVAAALDLLRFDRADALATGGMDAVYDIFYRAHDQFGVMNPESEPGESCAPFGRRHGGFVMGEGGFGLWLERRPQHRAHVLGEVLGAGSASVDLPLHAWPRSPEPLVRTMKLALDDAEVDPSSVGVVYASANATRLDEVEAAALATLVGGAATVVTSIKGAIGEFGASGAAACVAAVACGAAGKVPPIANLRSPHPSTAPLRLATTATDVPGEIVLVNSFASGGTLVSVVLRVFRDRNALDRASQ